MPLPSSIIGAFVLVAEKVLVEADGVPSIIRIIDVFSFQRNPGIPVESQPIFMYVIASVRFEETEPSEHVLQLQLVRPSGETKPIGDPHQLKSEPKVTGVVGIPSGFNFISIIGVIPTETGVHYIVLFMDGREITRAPITLAPTTDISKPE
jgi:hypothetical protein